MSDKSTLLTLEHFCYIAQHTRGDDAFMKELRAAAQEAGIPSISIAAEQASFIRVLLRLAGGRAGGRRGRDPQRLLGHRHGPRATSRRARADH